MTIAMTVQGRAITVEQRDAAIKVMRGRFEASDIRFALMLADVEVPRDYPWLIDRVADRILQAERRAGRIRPVKGKRGLWERVDG